MKFSNLTFFSSITKGKIREKKREKEKKGTKATTRKQKNSCKAPLQGKHRRAFLPAVRRRFSQSREDAEVRVFSSSRGVWIGPFALTLVASVKVGNKSLPLPELLFCLCQASDISYLSFSTGQASPSYACLLRGSLLDYNFYVLSAFSCFGFSLLLACPCCPQYYHTDRNKHFSPHWLQAASGSLPVVCAGIQPFPNI